MSSWVIWAKRIGIGVLVGLVGALVMTAVMALLRIGPGISPPAELLGDRIVPTINVRHFIDLIVKYGGPSQLKQIPIKASIAGQIGVGILFGIIYGVIAQEGKGQRLFGFGRLGLSRRGFVYISAVVLVLWAATIIYLWPVLWSNYRGLPPTPARIVTMIGTLISYASYGVTVLFAYHALAGPFPPQAASPSDDRVHMGRRAVLVGGVGVVAAVSGAGLIRALYNRATFSYDGTRYHPADAEYIVPYRPFLHGHQELDRPGRRKIPLAVADRRAGRSSAHLHLRSARLPDAGQAGHDAGVHQQRGGRRPDEQRHLDRCAACAICSTPRG